MLAFVTVGSTRFDSLVQSVLSPPVLSALRLKGYTQLVVQCGNSIFELASSISDGGQLAVKKEGVAIELWKFKPTLQNEYERADLVISHAGSGTILDVLRLGKPLLVVVNPTLLDNHQQELASALEGLGHLKHSTIPDLYQIIESFDPSSLIPFPPFDGSQFANMAPKTLEPAVVDEDPQSYENKNVHAIYDEIASHFSSTRYKPWPVISTFMSSISTGWVGLDAGTGNGKYLPLPLDRPTDILTIGLDRSINLLQIARTAGEAQRTREVVWGDVLGHGWRPAIFDYAISIATIHHLATHERRIKAVQRLIESVSSQHGRILIYVWAIEQDELSKRKVVADSDAESDGRGKDVVVPWVLSPQKGAREDSAERQVFNRYYHMFAKGELSGLVYDAAKDLGLDVGPSRNADPLSSCRQGIEIVQDGWERSNYYVELKRWEIPDPTN
ncbi:hypothetical protein C0991_005568 [Blastosporella zonata]|nr:hypothetical protein C0991_005568 [Blastosporella zonata]